jgi:predicted Zn-dependent peptidase
LKEATKVTTLANGVRVVSEDNGGFASNLGIYTNIGSRHEPVRGLGQLRSRLLFQSTPDRFNPVRVMRDAQESSCNCKRFRDFSFFLNFFFVVQCEVSIETTSFTVSGLRENVAVGFDILADLALNGKFVSFSFELRFG